jgi:hypothetical protein
MCSHHPLLSDATRNPDVAVASCSLVSVVLLAQLLYIHTCDAPVGQEGQVDAKRRRLAQRKMQEPLPHDGGQKKARESTQESACMECDASAAAAAEPVGPAD